MAKGNSSSVVLHTLSPHNNHILTVQMRKWLIALLINIMSYYPGQVEKLFHQARIYLSLFTYAPVRFPALLFRVRSECFSICAMCWLVFNSGNMIGCKLFSLCVKIHIYESPALGLKQFTQHFITPSLVCLYMESLQQEKLNARTMSAVMFSSWIFTVKGYGKIWHSMWDGILNRKLLDQ